MGIVEAILLGIVQGLTEFLPISSSAHLRVVPALLGFSDPGTQFTAIIQLGSSVAVVAYFFDDLRHLATDTIVALQKRDFEAESLRMVAAIAIGTLPICIVGLVLKHILEAQAGFTRSLLVIGCASMVMGILLFVAEQIGNKKRTLANIGVRDGLLVGLAQVLALIPGCSRSGSTLTVALLMNLKRDDAARFSFLLGIPAIVLSGLLELKEALPHVNHEALTSLLVSLLASFICSYISIAWLLKFLRTHHTWSFSIYRLLFGLVAIYLAFR